MRLITRKLKLGVLAASAITLLAMGGEPGTVRADGGANCPCKSQGYFKNHDFCDLLGEGLLPGPHGYTGAISPDRSYGPYYNFEELRGQRGLKLGDFAYTCEELHAILSTPSQGNGALILAKQLIAAKLNVLNGCPATPAILAAIAEADMLLWQSTVGLQYDWVPRMLPPVGTMTLPSNYVLNGMSLQTLKGILENYNLCGAGD